jgi:hypothetical protein
MDMSEFQKDPSLAKLADQFTVEAIVKFLEPRLNAR